MIINNFRKAMNTSDDRIQGRTWKSMARSAKVLPIKPFYKIQFLWSSSHLAKVTLATEKLVIMTTLSLYSSATTLMHTKETHSQPARCTAIYSHT